MAGPLTSVDVIKCHTKKELSHALRACASAKALCTALTLTHPKAELLRSWCIQCSLHCGTFSFVLSHAEVEQSVA